MVEILTRALQLSIGGGVVNAPQRLSLGVFVFHYYCALKRVLASAKFLVNLGTMSQ